MVQRNRKQKVKKRKSWLSRFGKNGIIQSLIVHVFIILFMAISFTAVTKEHLVKLSISFDSEEELSIEPIQIEIPQPELDEEESEILTNIVDLNDDVEIKIDTVEFLKESSSSLPIEDISTELINSTVTSTSLTSTPRNRSASVYTPATNEFNTFMKGKLDDRLAKHGARSGDIQVSISWDDYNDIDLWVEFQPFNSPKDIHTIGWTNRQGINGGYLDIDMNVQPFTNEAVENIVWPPNRSPYGTYTVYAHYYHQWDRNDSSTVYLRVQHDDNVVYRKSMVTFGRGPQKIYTFTRKPSKSK
jgi:hypothetical protein